MVFEAKYVIIGGGIAGTAAAETLRKEDPKARIIIERSLLTPSGMTARKRKPI